MTEMVDALMGLRSALLAAELPLDLPGADALRTSRRAMAEQLEDYAIPRLRTLDAPLLAVVGGSTGAGKSTLVNSVVGHRVTAPGVLRPTTRSPVLVHHPDDASWFGQDRLLPDLERVSHSTDDPRSLQLVTTTSIPRGLALLDAPDVDSVEERNRQLAAQLLAAADLWLFVTSAARYADQVPWGFLQQASERSTSVAIVLDRTPEEAVGTVSSHLARMLSARGLRDSPLFIVREATVDREGLLPAEHVHEVRGWLQALAADADARAAIVQQTLEGAIRDLTRRAHPLADALAEQGRAAQRLRDDVDAAYDEALTAIGEACADGTLLRGEVLARWQEFVGTGELLRSLETGVGRLRDRLVNAVRGKPHQVERVTVAVESGLETLVLEHSEAAAERAEAAWLQSPAGRVLLERGEKDLGRASRDLRAQVEREVREWQQDVLDMVRNEGADKRSTARFLAFGVNGLSVSLMVVVFASTAGVTGAEFGIAGGSAVLGQKLLEAVFGDQAVRRLAESARRSLDQRLRVLLRSERDRFTGLLDQHAPDPGATDRLRAAVRAVDDLRSAARRRGGVAAPTTTPSSPTSDPRTHERTT